MKKAVEEKKYTDPASYSNLAMFTDLYELRMMQAYLKEGLTGEAVFSLSVRRMPPRRNLLIACGLETVLEYLEGLCFQDEDIDYLRSLGGFSDSFLSWLRTFRFEGDVRALPEGTPFFPNEPILEVAGPLPQAQLIETFVMNQVHLQSLLASKAFRVVSAAGGRPVVDFGSRRTHGTDAALKAARALYIGGVSATSNVLAGRLWDIPVAGTMAHSYIQAHEDEAEAFRTFASLYPGTTLLVDTYDSIEAAKKIVELSKRHGDAFCIKAVRLDSGDLASLSVAVRGILDEGGLKDVEIFASGGLDEYGIRELLSAGAPIDGFGVGTSMVVSKDAPDMDIAYKLCEYAGKGRIKLSDGKQVLAGRKQVFRFRADGPYFKDVIGLEGEDLPGRPLLVPVMRRGKRTAPPVSLREARAYAEKEIGLFPSHLKETGVAKPPYPVEVSRALSDYQRGVEQSLVTQGQRNARWQGRNRSRA
jgi:nicotinate phosphoribosyltransferase